MTIAPPLRPQRRFKLSRPAAIALTVVGVAAIALAAWALRPKALADPYRLGSVTRGEISRSVSASGVLEALVTVEVGSQISGLIKQVMVDFNDQVKRGQLLAEIDPGTYTSRLQQAQADVAAGGAGLAQQNAAYAQAVASADVARAQYNRTKTLADKGYMSAAALDTAEAEYKRSAAGISVARAQIGAQAARVAQSRAALQSNQVDLSRTRIVSPIDGVVVDRQIEPGQTVAASLQAPVLFRIAQDLSKLEVKIKVDEADIGQVREGQAVRFTVDAFPDENFQGRVTQVRMQPEAESNVVAYIVMAQADNPDRKLLPGMTANADIIIERRPNVLRVPAAALRFTPADQQPQPAQGGGFGGGPPGGGGFGGPPGAGGGGGGQRSGGGGGGQRILSQLNLDAGQKAKADAIFAEMRQKMQGGGGDRAARRLAMDAAYAKLEPILKPEQKKQLAVLRARSGGQGRRGGMQGGVVYILKNGKPEAVTVRVGATDGSFTQVAGSLKEGDQVIVGGGPKAKAKTGGAPLGGAAPRVRF